MLVLLDGYECECDFTKFERILSFSLIERRFRENVIVFALVLVGDEERSFRFLAENISPLRGVKIDSLAE
jgi:hypothetical protein